MADGSGIRHTAPDRRCCDRDLTSDSLIVSLVSMPQSRVSHKQTFDDPVNNNSLISYWNYM